MGLMDLKKKESVSGEEDTASENKKCCSDCKTTKTPLWRGGPAGPKSLCNACGIRYRKRRVPDNADVSSGSERKRGKIGNSDEKVDLSECLKMRIVELGKEVLLQQRIVKKQRCQRRRVSFLGEEEKQAAVSLMALSCGFVFV